MFLQDYPFKTLTRASDDPGTQGWMKMHPRQAVERTFIWTNPARLTKLIVLDIDSPDSEWLVKERVESGEPAPNYLTINPHSGHAHAMWVLAEPVVTSQKGSLRAQRYLADVTESMRERYEADAGYRGTSTRSPLSEEHVLSILATEPYTLADLMPDGSPRPRRAPAEVSTFVGRNVDTFDTVRQWAYRAHRRHQTFESFEQAVYLYAVQHNALYGTPMPGAEVRAISRSISRWVWRRFTTFSERQSALGKRSGASRRAQAVTKAEKARAMRDMGLGVQEIMDTLMVSRRSVYNYLKEA